MAEVAVQVAFMEPWLPETFATEPLVWGGLIRSRPPVHYIQPPSPLQIIHPPMPPHKSVYNLPSRITEPRGRQRLQALGTN